MSVSYHGRIVMVCVSHIGIDEDYIKYIMASQTFRRQVEKFREEFKVITELARQSSATNTILSPAIAQRNRSTNNMVQNIRGLNQGAQNTRNS
jgi:hypothetical protein